jgi:eukaryotic-like serine/threonine-protein kinase
MIGQTISHYKILEKLGEGGMGVVYKAEDTKLKRIVAIKFLPKRLSVHGEERERFIHEAQAASALNHPNICVIHEIDEVEDESFIVMEYMDGVTLREWIRKKAEQSEGYRKLGMKEAIDLAAQIAEGLEKAHEKGIIHRDVKSENIMVTSDGRAKIMDFGLAKLKGVSKLTKTGSTVGTIAYMSPEQVEGIETDHRTDIFSFGVVIYEMLTGHLPFRAEHETAMMYEIINVEPQSLIDQHKGIDPELNRIVMKCLEKDREERYQSMREVAVDLKRYKRDSEGRRIERKSDARELSSTSEPISSGEPSKTRWSKIGLASFGAIVLICLGIYLFLPKAVSINSIAVLPFSDITADPGSEYLCDGFTESLINSLSILPGVKLMSRSSVFRFKGKDIDPQKAGKDLGVGAVLTGRLTQHGDALMISVEPVDVKDNSHIWGNQYQRKLSDILAIQSDISQEISNKLKITLTGDQQRALVEHPTENADAYKLYLQGLFYWNKRTKEGFEKAIEYYQQAISKDPSYALAYAGLANVYALQGSYFLIPTKESIEKARAMALKALQFNERLAEAHAALASLYENYEWKWEDADREYKRAIDLNPNYATAHQWYGEFLCAMRRFDEGNAQHQRAIEIDPLSPVTFLSAGFDLVVQKRYDEARNMVIKSLEIDPTFPRGIAFRGQLSFLTGKPQEALKDLRAVVALSDSSDEYVAYLGNVLGLIGNRAEATTLLRTLLKRQQSRYVDPSLTAIVYIGLGEKDHAFQWLEKAYEVHSNQVEYLLIDPLYDPIRNDPRFSKLVKKIGLDK